MKNSAFGTDKALKAIPTFSVFQNVVAMQVDLSALAADKRLLDLHFDHVITALAICLCNFGLFIAYFSAR